MHATRLDLAARQEKAGTARWPGCAPAQQQQQQQLVWAGQPGGSPRPPAPPPAAAPRRGCCCRLSPAWMGSLPSRRTGARAPAPVAAAHRAGERVQASGATTAAGTCKRLAGHACGCPLPRRPLPSACAARIVLWQGETAPGSKGRALRPPWTHHQQLGRVQCCRALPFGSPAEGVFTSKEKQKWEQEGGNDDTCQPRQFFSKLIFNAPDKGLHSWNQRG